MKLFLFLLFVRLCCPHYYTVDTVAVPDASGCSFVIEHDGQLHEYGSFDHYSGTVTVVMNNNSTDDTFIDDEVVAIIKR